MSTLLIPIEANASHILTTLFSHGKKPYLSRRIWWAKRIPNRTIVGKKHLANSWVDTHNMEQWVNARHLSPKEYIGEKSKAQPKYP